MTELKLTSRLLVATLAIAGLTACGTMGGFETQESVAMADDDLGLGGNGYITAETPISSAHPVRGLDDRND